MRKWISAFTLIELLVVIAIIAILAGLLLPALARAREESRRKACNSNMGQIVKACTTYQEPNGDFFPAHDQAGAGSAPLTAGMYPKMDGTSGAFLPMPSLAVLYPTYADNQKVFTCPSTADKSNISIKYVNGAKHVCFGNQVTVDAFGDPAGYSGTEVTLDTKCSYLYDEQSHFRDVGPSQAMLADADGQTWKKAAGGSPDYVTGWVRMPRRPNHDSGQNVMYFDGHVKWMETAYASDDPKDNIWCPNGATVADQWGADTDAYLWDGNLGDSRTLQKD
jgi:prepilin-type N-terminal cleavage/methylation domain-containing protein/prepilin-type processing-associated H-X9-DG protein